MQVVRNGTTTRIQMHGITTIPEQISGAVNLTWAIRGKIHKKRVLALIRNLRTQGHRLRTTRKIHIKMRHLTLRMGKNIRKTLVKR